MMKLRPTWSSSRYCVGLQQLGLMVKYQSELLDAKFTNFSASGRMIEVENVSSVSAELFYLGRASIGNFENCGVL